MAKLQVPDNVVSAASVNSDALTEAHLTVLWAITLAYNGVGVQHGTQVHHISCSRPPKLQTLIGCSDTEWKEVYEPAFEDFQSAGGVTEKTIMARTVSWAPTEKLLELTAELFADHLDRIVVPHSAFNTGKGHIGDPVESLLHRTGVEQALSWLNDAGYHWELYPGKPGHKRPDIRGKPLDPSGHDTMMASDIEMISDHNNKEMYIKKYAMFSNNPSRTSLWIFKNRKEASKVITHLSMTDHSRYMRQEYPSCSIDNTPIRNGENYSLKTLNRYLKQSQEKSQLTCTGMDYVQTLTGMSQRRNIDAIRKPVTIWHTNNDTIELHGPLGKTASITVDELNAGAKLRMEPVPKSDTPNLNPDRNSMRMSS